MGLGMERPLLLIRRGAAKLLFLCGTGELRMPFSYFVMPAPPVCWEGARGAGEGRRAVGCKALRPPKPLAAML